MSSDLFFFSSRRRHTRYIGDWSSDVCSSDLPPLWAGSNVTRQGHEVGVSGMVGWPAARRSEERRVGKECRSRWSPYHSKKMVTDEERDYMYSAFARDARMRVKVGIRRSMELLNALWFSLPCTPVLYYGDDICFSSRRRHTSYSGDWSSDVCSSDLRARAGYTPAGWNMLQHMIQNMGAPIAPRSEERRVGKECRSRWSPYH